MGPSNSTVQLSGLGRSLALLDETIASYKAQMALVRMQLSAERAFCIRKGFNITPQYAALESELSSLSRNHDSLVGFLSRLEHLRSEVTI